MRTDKKVLAICANFNGKQVLPQTLASLLASSHPALETVVVDNNSNDGSADQLPASVGLVRLEENRGYAAALNSVLEKYVSGWKKRPAGGRQMDPTYFLLLNNDITLEPALISRLVDFAEANGPGVYGPKVLLEPDRSRLDAAWGELTWSHVLARLYGKGEADSPRYNQVRRVELLLGCILLVHRRVLETVGLLDERFFMYHEEVDFLYRCRSHDFPVFYCPFAEAYHHSGFGFRHRPLEKVYWVRRNTVVFLRKHRPGLGKWSRFGLSLAASLAYNLISLRWRRTQAILKGIADGWRLEM